MFRKTSETIFFLQCTPSRWCDNFHFQCKKNIKHDFVDVCNNPESHAANDSNKQYVAKETDTYSIIAYCSI